MPNAAKRIVHGPLDPKVNDCRGYRSAGQMRIKGTGTYDQPLPHFSDANALASSSVKNVSLCRGDRRATALTFDFGNSNETYQILRGSNDISNASTPPLSNTSATGICPAHETARSSAASPHSNGHGFDFPNGIHTTGDAVDLFESRQAAMRSRPVAKASMTIMVVTRRLSLGPISRQANKQALP